MKNTITKRKTESDIRIFNDLLSTVWELCNPEDIGIEERNMHHGKTNFSAHEIQIGLRTYSLKCARSSVSRYLSDGEY